MRTEDYSNASISFTYSGASDIQHKTPRSCLDKGDSRRIASISCRGTAQHRMRFPSGRRSRGPHPCFVWVISKHPGCVRCRKTENQFFQMDEKEKGSFLTTFIGRTDMACFRPALRMQMPWSAISRTNQGIIVIERFRKNTWPFWRSTMSNMKNDTCGISAL